MPRGRRPYPWIKLWFDMLNDVKMNRLSIAERGCWTGILLLAGQSPERGKLLLTETEPMNTDDIAGALHLTPDEVPALESCISKLVALNSLRWNGHCLEVINFKKRQEVYESDFKDYHVPDEKKLRINSELTPNKVLKEGEGRGKRKDVDVEEDTTPKGGRKKRPAPQTDPSVKEIFGEVKKYLGYPEKTGGRDPIPNYGMEGQAIKRMFTRGFTREEILACWRSKVSQRGGEYVSMKWVNQDILDFARGGEPLPDKINQGGKIKSGRKDENKGQRVAGARPASDFSGRKW